MGNLMLRGARGGRAVNRANQRDGERNLARARAGRAVNLANQRGGERNLARARAGRAVNIANQRDEERNLVQVITPLAKVHLPFFDPPIDRRRINQMVASHPPPQRCRPCAMTSFMSPESAIARICVDHTTRDIVRPTRAAHPKPCPELFCVFFKIRSRLNSGNNIGSL